MEDEDRVRTFIISWDMTGLECVIDADELQGENVLRALKGERSDALRNTLQMLMLRARYNTQRHYEIYSINTAWEISKEDLEQMFENDPQGSADLIRERGKKLYSDRINKPTQVIQ